MSTAAAFTYSDFLGFDVVREGGTARVVVDHTPRGPVRLIGFTADAALSDLEVREGAWDYYQDLAHQLGGDRT